MKKTITLLLALIMILSAAAGLADDSNNMNKDGYSTSYTYGYDYWSDMQESPDAYRVKTVIDSITLGLDDKAGKLNKPQSLLSGTMTCISWIQVITGSFRLNTRTTPIS